MWRQGRVIGSFALTATLLVAGCIPNRPSPPPTPTANVEPTTWSTVELNVPTGPSNAHQSGLGVTGVLLAGGSEHPWINRLGETGTQAVAADVLGRMPRATEAAGIARFGPSAFALFGKGVDGEVPMTLVASPDDVHWRTATPPVMDPSLEPRGLTATDELIAALGSAVRMEDDEPITRLTAYASQDGVTWAARNDPLLVLMARPIIYLAADGQDLIVFAGPSPIAFDEGGPDILIGRDGGTSWDSFELGELEERNIEAIAAKEGRLAIAGCTLGGMDPSTAMVWIYTLSDPTDPDEVALSSADSCATAIAWTDDGLAVVGEADRETTGWRWDESTGAVTTTAFPEAERFNSRANSLTATGSSLVASGSTFGDPFQDRPQLAAAWAIPDANGSGH